MQTLSRRPVLLFSLIFVVITAVLLTLQAAVKGGVDYPVLIAGNAVLFLATLLSFMMFRKSFRNNSPHHFLRYVYGGIFIKMAICLVAAVAYILDARNAVDKTALFACFGLYIIYTFAEVRILTESGREKNNV